jgi:hypothetical protein
MPVLIVTDKGEKPMSKKKGFLDYGKEDEPEAADEPEESEDSSPAEMRLKHLAEQTGVEDPGALLKLIKACMASGE